MASLLTDDQRTEEWFKERAGRATASHFGDVMSVIRSGEAAARKNYRAQLVIERLTGMSAETYQNAAMLWGVDMEPLARLLYMAATGNMAVECGFYKHDSLEAGASPDGLIDDDGLLEIKCPNTATHIETLKLQSLPSQYVGQVQGQLWITGRQWVDFVSFDPRLPDNAAMIIIRVAKDTAYIEKLETEVTKFLEEVDKEVEFIKGYKAKKEKTHALQAAKH